MNWTHTTLAATLALAAVGGTVVVASQNVELVNRLPIVGCPALMEKLRDDVRLESSRFAKDEVCVLETVLHIGDYSHAEMALALRVFGDPCEVMPPSNLARFRESGIRKVRFYVVDDALRKHFDRDFHDWSFAQYIDSGVWLLTECEM